MPASCRLEFADGFSPWWITRSLSSPEKLSNFVMGHLSLGEDWVRAVHLRMQDGSRVVVRRRAS